MTLVPKLAGALLLLALTAPALAQTPEDKATAEALFTDARRLMEAKNYPAACAKLEASQKLDPAVGTLFNLASCYELSLRTASAFATWRQVESLAGQVGEKKREKYAHDRADALEKQVPKVVIKVPDTPGLVVKRNGVVVDPSLFGMPLSVDPGGYVLDASAPGYQPYHAQLQAVDGQQAEVAIPALVAAPVTPEPTPAPTPAPTPTPAPAPVLTPPVAPAPVGAEHRPLRKWSYVVGGVGLATLGVGVVFGVMARSSWNTAEQHCDTKIVCDRTGFNAANDAKSSATLSTVLVSVGAATTVAGVVMWLMAPRVRSREASASLGPAPIGDLGMAWQGRF